MDLTTPAVLFPAISLLMLAYTNRFLGLARLIRDLHARHQSKPDPLLLEQLGNLRFRIFLIRNMQAVGVLSLIFCVLCMGLLFEEQVFVAKLAFGIALLLMVFSLTLSLAEIWISINALNMQLRDLEQRTEGSARA